MKKSYFSLLNSFSTRRAPYLIRKLKVPRVKLIQTSVEFIFDRKLTLKRKHKKSNPTLCASNRVCVQNS